MTLRQGSNKDMITLESIDHSSVKLRPRMGVNEPTYIIPTGESPEKS